MSISEFKPTILFLVKFVAIYLVGNLLYAWFITSYEPTVDPATHSVTEQTVIVLNVCGYRVEAEERNDKATTGILHMGRRTLSVYEGCNGINTMVIFVAFLLAFGPYTRSLWWFVPLGLLIIHSVNLMRLSLLFFVSQYLPKAMYFTHKYFFTAILYVVIFAMWLWWVRRFATTKDKVSQHIKTE